MGERTTRFIWFLCLLVMMPFLLSQQTQNLPARADKISPGFPVLEQARQFKTGQQYPEAFRLALEASGYFQRDTAWTALGESLELAYQSAFRQGEREHFQTLLSRLLGAEWIASMSSVPAKTKAVLLGRIGSCQHFLGDYPRAVSYYDKALPYAEEAGDTALLSRLYGNNGVLIWEQGDDFRARPYLEKALELATIRKDTSLMINIASSLGNVLRTLNSDRCIPVLRQALTLDPANSQTLMLLSKAYLEVQFEPNQALEYAIASIHHAGSGIEQADAYHQTGRVYLSKKDPDKALAYFKRALAAARKSYGEQHPECVKIHVYEGDAWLLKGRLDEALTAYNTALEQFLPLFHPADNQQDPSDLELTESSLWVMDALLGKAKAWNLIYEAGKNKACLEHSLQCAERSIAYQNKIRLKFADDESKFSLNQYFIPCYESALKSAFHLYQNAEMISGFNRAFAIAEQTKGVVLSEALFRKEIKTVAGIPPEILEEEKAVQISLAGYEKKILECHSPQLKTGLQDTLFQIRRTAEKMEARIRNQYPAYSEALFGYQNRVSADSIAHKLPENAAMIEYFLGDSALYTFLITRDTCWVQKQHLPPGFDQQLNTYLRTVRDWKFVADSSSEASQVFLRSGYDFYRLLLEKPLALTKASRLFIVPDGKLGFLPFELLLTRAYQGKWIDRDIPFVLNNMAISYRFSGRFSEKGNGRSAGEGWGGFGLEYGEPSLPGNTPESQVNHLRDFGPLPYANKEIMSVSNMLGGDFWLNNDATRENFLKNAEKYGILHLAMHGIVDENNALHSKLIFANQITGTDPAVYASDLYQMQLRAGLAVLSACQSGAGTVKNGEGVMSLARAFAFAGCPSMVMSLWNVSDQSTSEIMMNFYKELKSGATKDEALRKAKLAYLKQAPAEYAKPIYWAAFVPIGEMDRMDPDLFVNWRHLYRAVKIAGVVILLVLLFWRWFADRI